MKVSVWDTYVKRDGDKIMHFDILVPRNLKKEENIFQFGATYLKSKPFKTGTLTSNECKFCHIEQASNTIIEAIKTNGFYIIEMQNCN